MSDTYRVAADDTGLRLDALALRVFDEIETRAASRKAFKRGMILLDGEPARSAWYGREGQELSWHPDRRVHPPNSLHPEVVYQDEHLAVVVKPPGILTNGNKHRTLERGLPNVLPLIDGYPPHPAHRLDYETTGLVLCGRTPAAMRSLTSAFERRAIHKTYRAIAVGRLEGEGLIEAPLDGRSARTSYRALQFNRSLKVGWCTELELHPETGRMHQIRRHLASIGHSILGDRRYPSGPVYHGNGLFLAAVGLQLDHPLTEAPLTVEMPSPAKFSAFQRRENRRWNKWRPHDTVPVEE